MSNRSKLSRCNDGGVILDPRRIAEPTPIRTGEAIETLEELRNTVQAQEWRDGNAKHSVMYGIKLCLHALKQKQPNETTE